MTIRFSEDNTQTWSRTFANLDYAADYLHKHIVFSEIPMADLKNFLKVAEKLGTVSVQTYFDVMDVKYNRDCSSRHLSKIIITGNIE